MRLVYSALACKLAAEQSVDGVLDDLRIPLKTFSLLSILEYDFISGFSYNRQSIRMDNLSIFLDYLGMRMLFRPFFE